MRITIVLSFVFVLLSFGFITKSENNAAYSDVALLAIDNASYLSQIEKEMLREINLVRTNPKVYLGFVKNLLEETIQDSLRLSQIVSESIKTRVIYEPEGEVVTVDTTYNNFYVSKVSAIRELVEELHVAEPINSLLPIENLYIAAKKHGDSQIAKSHIQHLGPNGTWPIDRIKLEMPWATSGNENIVSGKGSPRDMVIQLLVDSGVKKRGHRKNILNPRWTHFSCYNVKALNKDDYKWWIQEFAF